MIAGSKGPAIIDVVVGLGPRRQRLQDHRGRQQRGAQPGRQDASPPWSALETGPSPPETLPSSWTPDRATCPAPSGPAPGCPHRGRRRPAGRCRRRHRLRLAGSRRLPPGPTDRPATSTSRTEWPGGRATAPWARRVPGAHRGRSASPSARQRGVMKRGTDYSTQVAVDAPQEAAAEAPVVAFAVCSDGGLHALVVVTHRATRAGRVAALDVGVAEAEDDVGRADLIVRQRPLDGEPVMSEPRGLARGLQACLCRGDGRRRDDRPYARHAIDRCGVTVHPGQGHGAPPCCVRHQGTGARTRPRSSRCRPGWCDSRCADR